MLHEVDEIRGEGPDINLLVDGVLREGLDSSTPASDTLILQRCDAGPIRCAWSSTSPIIIANHQDLHG